MTKYAVRWTDKAEASVADILANFADHHRLHAEKILEEILEKGDGLERFPLRGRVVPELAATGEEGLREIFHKPWRIIYETQGLTVHILLVIDGRRDCEEALRELLIQKNFPS